MLTDIAIALMTQHFVIQFTIIIISSSFRAQAID